MDDFTKIDGRYVRNGSYARRRKRELEKSTGLVGLAGAVRATKAPPCDTCRFRRVCGTKLYVCEAFRRYIYPPKGGQIKRAYQIPDMTWAEFHKFCEIWEEGDKPKIKREKPKSRRKALSRKAH